MSVKWIHFYYFDINKKIIDIIKLIIDIIKRIINNKINSNLNYNIIMENNNDILNFILDDDDSNIDNLTQELIEVDKKEDTNLVNKLHDLVEEKKEIIIEIKIDSIEDENELDFIDDDFEYIDEDENEDDESDKE